MVVDLFVIITFDSGNRMMTGLNDKETGMRESLIGITIRYQSWLNE